MHEVQLMQRSCLHFLHPVTAQAAGGYYLSPSYPCVPARSTNIEAVSMTIAPVMVCIVALSIALISITGDIRTIRLINGKGESM
jgi:hypothetical protein